MKQDIEKTIEHAQKITLGQIDNGTLATAVNCADTLAIARHGRVESYVIPKHLIDELLMKMAVLECDNKRLLGERVAESIPVPKSHFFNHDFKIDMGAVTKCDMPHVSEQMREMEISRRLRTLEGGPTDFLPEDYYCFELGNFRAPVFTNARRMTVVIKPEQTPERATNPNCPYCTNSDCDAVRCLYDNLSQVCTSKNP